MQWAPAIFLLIFAFPAAAQEQQSQADEGMLPTWEVVEIAEELKAHVNGVQQILEQVRPKEWLQDGAPQAYVDQYENLQQDLAYLGQSADALAVKPDKLTIVIDTFLWLDRLHSMLGSMTTGVRKYQSDPIADLLDSAGSRNNGAIEQLKGYMRQLASSTEDQMSIAHEEAQRCRSEIVNKPRP